MCRPLRDAAAHQALDARANETVREHVYIYLEPAHGPSPMRDIFFNGLHGSAISIAVSNLM